MIQIKSWLTGKVLFEADVESLKACVELAVSKSVSLNYAELNYAELNYAKLNDAKLNYAELNYAKLNFAKLKYAELNYAELKYAELNNAKLNGAELNNAKLNGAKLVRIDGLKFSVIISPTHVHIGCKRFTIERFRNFDFDKFKDHASCFHQYPIVISMLDAIAEQSTKKTEAA